MKPILALICGPLLAACVAADASVPTIDGTRLTVLQDDTYYWPAPRLMRSSTGEMVEVEPFPIVTALVVARADGKALTEADEDIARRAANFYCDDTGAGLPGPSSRFADGAWAFGLCTSPAP
ncbi:MAG: hypothetical protein MUE52_15430 [Tabrizicola sp.]|jgi:hypothetical protein|nr:hypothetical protein [Tabrizicola sp.]